MIEKFIDFMENYLDAKKLSPPIKKIIKFNTIFIFFGILFSLIFFSVTNWFFWLFISAALGLWNFIFLSISIQKIINFNMINSKNYRNAKMKQFFLFNLRLFISGIFLYICLVHWNANPFSLALGLAIPLFSVPILLIVFRN